MQAKDDMDSIDLVSQVVANALRTPSMILSINACSCSMYIVPLITVIPVKIERKEVVKSVPD
jgi:hypothetical protein